MSSSKRTFQVLDAFRGIAALTIVARHCGDMLGGLHLPISFLAVDLFFLMSGVVIASSYEPWLLKGGSIREFMIRRVVRLYPLYIAALGLALAQYVVHHAAAPQDASESTFGWGFMMAVLMLPSFGLNPILAPRWSLFFELVANFFYARFLGNLTTKNLAALCAVAAVGLMIISYLNGAVDGVNLLGLLRVSFSFFLGVILYRLYDGRYVVSQALGIGLTLIVGLALSLPIQVHGLAASYVEIFCLFPLLVWAAMHVEVHPRLAKLSAFLGSISYAVYVLHAPLATSLHSVVVKRLGIIPAAHPLVVSAIYLGVLLLGCWLADALFDRPARRWLVQMFSNRKRALATVRS